MKSEAFVQERGTREVRQRAEAALQYMTPANLFRCGLTCDYTLECLNFLRDNFDIEDPDPAVLPTAVQRFCQRMLRLFRDGFILGKAMADKAPDAAQTSREAAPATVSKIVLEQVDFPEPSLASSSMFWIEATGSLYAF